MNIFKQNLVNIWQKAICRRSCTFHLAILTEIDNPSSFTWEIGVSKPEVGTNPSLNRGSAEVQTGSTLTEGLDTASPR